MEDALCLSSHWIPYLFSPQKTTEFLCTTSSFGFHMFPFKPTNQRFQHAPLPIYLQETSLIIYFHGNGEICEDYTHWSSVYEVFPCSMLVFDYRGYGWSTGKPSMADLTRDALAAKRPVVPNEESRKQPKL